MKLTGQKRTADIIVIKPNQSSDYCLSIKIDSGLFPVPFWSTTTILHLISTNTRSSDYERHPMD